MTAALRHLAALCAALCVLGPSASALADAPRIDQEGRFGLGLGIGSLAYGLSGKYYLSASRSVQANAGVQVTSSRFRNGDLFALGADYLFEFGAFASANEIDLRVGAGPGVGLALSTLGYAALDVNACVSAQILFHELPLDFAIEYRPALRLKSSPLYDDPGRFVYALANFGIQMRYYFSGVL